MRTNNPFTAHACAVRKIAAQLGGLKGQAFLHTHLIPLEKMRLRDALDLLPLYELEFQMTSEYQATLVA